MGNSPALSVCVAVEAQLNREILFCALVLCIVLGFFFLTNLTTIFEVIFIKLFYILIIIYSTFRQNFVKNMLYLLLLLFLMELLLKYTSNDNYITIDEIL